MFGLGPPPESEPKREVPIDTGMYELSRSHANAHVTPGYHENDIDKNKREQTKDKRLENTSRDAHLSTEKSSESPRRNQNGLLPLTDQDLEKTKNVMSECDKDDVTMEADCLGNSVTESQGRSKDKAIHGETVTTSECTKL